MTAKKAPIMETEDSFSLFKYFAIGNINTGTVAIIVEAAPIFTFAIAVMLNVIPKKGPINAPIAV